MVVSKRIQSSLTDPRHASGPFSHDRFFGAVGRDRHHFHPHFIRIVSAIETDFSGDLSLPQLFRAFALNPARRLGLASGRLSAGAPADLVLFDPDKPFVLDRTKLLSKSKNTPFDGARLQGKVVGTWVGGKRVFAA